MSAEPHRAGHKSRKSTIVPAIVAPPAAERRASRRALAVSIVGPVAILIIANLVVFAPVRHFEFVSFDDPSYVSENPRVAEGLTWRGVGWAFNGEHAGYWIPLTWLSYMSDVEAMGVGPGGHHVTNVLLHVLNALLLFGLLRHVTGASGRSLFVATLFAIHPLHVESVAWITERKDVLSTLFLMTALWAYVAYVRRPSAVRYAAVAASFACGLLAKPMLVTLPFLLVLLDIWPLGRLVLGPRDARLARSGASRVTWARALGEKLPLAAMSVAASLVTIAAQQRAGAVAELEIVGPGVRAATALTASASYMWKTIWPAGLAAFYPYDAAVRPWDVGLAVLALAGLSVLAARLFRHPYVLVGWLWYLVSLVPVIGLVQVGNQSMADRFTYVPLIGLFIAVSWGVPALFPRRNRVIAAMAVAVVAAFAVVAGAQVQTWKNDETLWTHALDVIPDNYFAHNSLGRLLYEQGQTTAAAQHFSEAVRLAPRFYDGRNNLGLVLLAQGRLDDAIAQFREAIRLSPTAEALNGLSAALAKRGDLEEAERWGLEAVRLKPGLAEAHFNLGLTTARQGRLDDALGHYLQARRLQPALVPVHQAIGETLTRLGRLDEAAAAFRDALRLDAGFADAHHGLGMALSGQGRLDEAIDEYAEAVRLAPGQADYQNDFGFSLAARGRIGEAIPRFSEAIRLAPDFEQAHYHLGLALAATGRFREAVAQFNEVLRLNPKSDDARRALGRLPKS
jgi:protein O-mannosyl-transferase